MRLVFTVAIALAMSLPAWGAAARQQDKAGSTGVDGQAPPSSNSQPGPSAEQAPAPAPAPAPAIPGANPSPGKGTHEEEKKAPESGVEVKTDNAPASTASDNADSNKTDSAKTNAGKTGPAKTDSEGPDSTKTSSTGKGTGAAGSLNGTMKRNQRPPSSASGPRKVVVRQGGAKEPATQIAPGMTPAEAARERQNAEQWLRTTGDQMPQLSILPDTSQQETVGQIRNYMAGACSALEEGDVRRASTLAEKGHLLAEDLLKR